MFRTRLFVRACFTKLTLILGLMMAFLAFQSDVAGQSANIALKGTYASSVTDGVDVFSGQLEQILPLINVQGRGEISQGLYLPLRNSAWDVMEINSTQIDNRSYYYYRAVQKTDFHDYFVRGGYGTVGKLEVETIFNGHVYAFGEVPSTTILRYTSNNGSIITFRDVPTDGQPLDARARGCEFGGSPYQTPNPPPACSRGRIFRSVDGSNVTFVADADIHDIVQIDPL